MTEQQVILAERHSSESPLTASMEPNAEQGTTSDVFGGVAGDDLVEMAQALAARVETFGRREQTDRAERDRLAQQARRAEEELQAERAQRDIALMSSKQAISDADLQMLVQVIDAAVKSPESLRDLLALSQHTALAATTIRDYMRLRDQSSARGSTDAV